MTKTINTSKIASADSKQARTAKPSNNTAMAKPSRLDQLASLLKRDDGASIAEMTEATGWQQHSVRGAMAGALKKRGLAISSKKIDGVRRYHASVTA